MHAYLLIACLACVEVPVEAPELAQKAVQAMGGEAKLLRLFRMKEGYSLSGPTTKRTERVSILEPPNHWWLGKTDRQQANPPEPATLLVWAWTAGVLVDPANKLTAIEPVAEGEKTLPGLRVAGQVEPPMDLYYDPQTWLLARIDWRGVRYHFSEWKDVDGTKFAAECVAFRTSGNEFVRTTIYEVERLAELPAGLERLPPKKP